MAIEYQLQGEDLHAAGEDGVKSVRDWLEGTCRFKIEHAIYDRNPQKKPPTKLRLPLIGSTVKDPRYERFDLAGLLLDERGQSGRELFVEVKDYAGASNQGKLYNDYLAVCYSAFVAHGEVIAAPPDWEFMWATTHPFSQNRYTQLTTAQQVMDACAEFPDRLGGRSVDTTVAEQVAERLWIAIVNPRVPEMIMGLALRQAVVAKMMELQPS